jgi:hypothetical protein
MHQMVALFIDSAFASLVQVSKFTNCSIRTFLIALQFRVAHFLALWGNDVLQLQGGLQVVVEVLCARLGPLQHAQVEVEAGPVGDLPEHELWVRLRVK